jgi:hypothetical protein
MQWCSCEDGRLCKTRFSGIISAIGSWRVLFGLAQTASARLCIGKLGINQTAMHLRRPRNPTTSRLRGIWIRLTARQRLFLTLAVITLFIGLIIYIISYLYFASWAPLVLLGTVLVPVLTVTLTLAPTLIEYIDQAQRERASEGAFRRETEHASDGLRPILVGIHELIPRTETALVLQQLQQHRPVLLTGESGTGKSGVAVSLVQEANNSKVYSLLIDARRLTAIETRGDIRTYLDIDEPFSEIVDRIGKKHGFLLIVDQLDSILV